MWGSPFRRADTTIHHLTANLLGWPYREELFFKWYANEIYVRASLYMIMVGPSITGHIFWVANTLKPHIFDMNRWLYPHW
jgi:hypothetical protein